MYQKSRDLEQCLKQSQPYNNICRTKKVNAQILQCACIHLISYSQNPRQNKNKIKTLNLSSNSSKSFHVDSSIFTFRKCKP